MSNIETPDYAAMLRRMVRAYGRRVAKDDPNELREMRELRKTLEEAIEVAVVGQYLQGFSWEEIADGLGMTRQAAWKRYHLAAGVAVARLASHDDAS